MSKEKEVSKPGEEIVSELIQGGLGETFEEGMEKKQMLNQVIDINSFIQGSSNKDGVNSSKLTHKSARHLLRFR